VNAGLKTLAVYYKIYPDAQPPVHSYTCSNELANPIQTGHRERKNAGKRSVEEANVNGKSV